VGAVAASNDWSGDAKSERSTERLKSALQKCKGFCQTKKPLDAYRRETNGDIAKRCMLCVFPVCACCGRKRQREEGPVPENPIPSLPFPYLVSVPFPSLLFLPFLLPFFPSPLFPFPSFPFPSLPFPALLPRSLPSSPFPSTLTIIVLKCREGFPLHRARLLQGNIKRGPAYKDVGHFRSRNAKQTNSAYTQQRMFRGRSQAA
jgi:hypothetical protein